MVNANSSTTSDPLLWDLIAPGKDPVNEWKSFATGLNAVISAVRKDYSFPQSGAKTGQTYYEHAIKGVHAIVQIYPRADLDPPLENERSMRFFKMICVAYVIHDLNKLPWFKPWNKTKWNVETARAELGRINEKDGVIDAFLPGWNDIINDMMILINGHSKIYANRGDELLVDASAENGGVPVTFDAHEMTTGIDIMRLADTLDLVHHPSRVSFEMMGIDTATGNEKKIVLNHKNCFKWMRELLSKICGEQMEINTVNVVKEASSFTNVIMNQAIDVLVTRGISPLRVFTTGMVMFGSVESFDRYYDGNKLRNDAISELVEETGRAFVTKIDDFMLRQEKNLFEYSSAGIKIADFAFQEPNAKEKTRKVIEYLARTIPALGYDKTTMDKRKKSSRFQSVVKLDNFLDEETKKHPLIARWESGMNDDLMDDDNAWKMGRLAHTVFITIPYIFKTWKETNVNQVELMKEMLEKLGIFDILEPVYDKPKNTSTVYRYYFFHLVGTALKESGKTIQSIVDPLVKLLHGKMDEVSIDEPFMNDPADFVRDHLQFFTTPATSTNLIQPSNPEMTITCSACGKKLKDAGSKKKNEKSYKWKSQQVIDGVPVEKFSNFLPGGMQGKGVRMICHSCMWRYYLDSILTTVSGKGVSTWYTTFYMEDGLPYDSIVSMKNVIDDLRGNPDGNTSFRVVPVDGGMKMKVQKAFGFMIPSIPDETCGSLTLTWKMKKSTVNEEFWDIMHDVSILASTTCMRAIVTRLRNDYEDLLDAKNDIVFQDIPGTFKQLIGGKDSISFDQAETVVNVMEQISRISREIVKEIGDSQAMNVKILDAIVTNGIIGAIHVIEHGWNDEKKKKNYNARARYLADVQHIHDLYLSLRS